MTVTDSDYIINPTLPPFDNLPDASDAAKQAVEIDKAANLCGDPVKRTMLKTLAASLWDRSVQTYINVYNQRGASI